MNEIKKKSQNNFTFLVENIKYNVKAEEHSLCLYIIYF